VDLAAIHDASADGFLCLPFECGKSDTSRFPIFLYLELFPVAFENQPGQHIQPIR
jgi:hypothetical protein